MNEVIAVRVVISALIGYLLGCISPSFLIGKRRGYDVRETGSKNAGASNTIIMAGKFAGVLVAVLDILKAAASWWIAAALFPELEFAGQIAGAACVHFLRWPSVRRSFSRAFHRCFWRPAGRRAPD